MPIAPHQLARNCESILKSVLSKRSGLVCFIAIGFLLHVGGAAIIMVVINEHAKGLVMLGVTFVISGSLLFLGGVITFCRIAWKIRSKDMFPRTEAVSVSASGSTEPSTECDSAERKSSIKVIRIPWQQPSEASSLEKGNTYVMPVLTGMEPQILPLIRTGFKVLYVPVQMNNVSGS